jgi:hypothetical protein
VDPNCPAVMSTADPGRARGIRTGRVAVRYRPGRYGLSGHAPGRNPGRSGEGGLRAAGHEPRAARGDRPRRPQATATQARSRRDDERDPGVRSGRPEAGRGGDYFNFNFALQRSSRRAI